MSEKPPKLFRNSILFQAILLGSFTFVAAVLLSSGNTGTREAIQSRAEEDLKSSIKQVVPSNLYDNNLLKSVIILNGSDGGPVTVYQGTKNNAVTALAFTVTGYGYGGKILVIMALTPEGKILGVRVLSHAETPGLGDKIEVERDDWILGFNGHSLGNPSAALWGVKKDGGRFDQFSGATITPRAVVKAVKSGLEFFAGNKTKLLTPLETKNEEAAK